MSILRLSKREEKLSIDKSDNKEEITIDGVSASKQYFSDDYLGQGIEVRLRVGSGVIQIVLISAGDKKEVSVFDKILNTFRIIR